MSWLANVDDRQALFGQLPEIAGPYFELEKSLWHQSHLPADILELCRLRLALLHRCAVEAASISEDLSVTKRDALAHWDTSVQFSAAERACLAFTEVYAMDTQALTDEHAVAVKQHFGDAGLVLLIEALGIFDGITRLSLLWQLAPGTDVDGRARQ